MFIILDIDSCEIIKICYILVMISRGMNILSRIGCFMYCIFYNQFLYEICILYCNSMEYILNFRFMSGEQRSILFIIGILNFEKWLFFDIMLSYCIGICF